MNPELEIGRFLTDVAHFPNCVPVAGALEYVAADGVAMTLALLQAYVANQGDGWIYTLDYLERFLEHAAHAAETVPPDVHGAYLALVQTLGVRTAELHVALAKRTGDPAFDPEPLERRRRRRAGRQRAVDEADATLRRCSQARVEQLAGDVRDEAAGTAAAARARALRASTRCAADACGRR